MLPLNLSVIGISETWLTSSNKNCYGIPQYTSEHLCRESKRGGGVSLFIKNGITYKRRSDLEISSPTIECIFIEIEKNSFNSDKNIIVGIVYRPPGTDISVFMEVFNSLLDLIKKIPIL